MVITLEVIKNVIGQFYKGELTTEDFTDLYYDAEVKLFSVKWKEKDYAALRHFVATKGDGTPPLMVNAGKASLPSDFFFVLAAYYRHAGKRTEIEFVNDTQAVHRLAHAYEFPTAEYPIGVVGGATVRFHPDTVKLVTFTYMQFPQPVDYVVDYTTGIPVFNATASTAIKWDTTEIVAMIQFILQSLSIVATQTEINNQLTNPKQ